MLKPIVIIVVLFCCGSCAPDRGQFSIPEIPEAQRYPAIQQQLQSARAWAVGHIDDPDALGRFAMVLQAYGMHEQADSVFAEARRLAPDQFRWAYLHGYTLDVLGRGDEAHDAFALATRINPRAGSTRLGAALLERGETVAARKILREALDYNQSDARALFELGRVESAAGNWSMAEQYLLKSLAAGAEHPSVYYALSDVYKQQGDDEKAAENLQTFEQLREQSVGWPDQWLAEVQSMSLSDRRLMDAAVRAIQTGDLRRAIELNEQARELNPNNALPAAALIGLYALVGEDEKSEAVLAIARELDPDAAQLHYNLGIARAKQGRLDDAITAMQRVTEIDPQGSLAWVKLAAIYAAQGNKEEAIVAYEQAHERTPADDDVRLKLGVLYVDTERYESALSMLDAATMNDRDEARRLWAVGSAHRNLGNPDSAIAALKNARDAAMRVGDTRLAAAVSGELERLNATTAN